MATTSTRSAAARSAASLADVPNDGFGVAEVVVWIGHQSDKALATRGFTAEAIAEALSLRLIIPTPRLGGYTASKGLTRARLGRIAANLGR